MINNFTFHIAPARSLVNDIQDDCQYIIISTDSRFDELGARDNVCLLHFADTELAGRPDACSREDVRRIWECLSKWTYPDIFVACDAGESRSPAVAAGLLRCFGQDDSFIWQSPEYRPNVHVYSMIIESRRAETGIGEELDAIGSCQPEEYRRYRRKGNEILH